MSSQSDLTRALSTGIGIVVSILFAFAIDASWDARSERLAEEAMIDGLREEFEANLVQIDDLLGQHRRADVLLVGFFGEASPASEADASLHKRRQCSSIEALTRMSSQEPEREARRKRSEARA